jgi:hypothetical protein
MRNKTSGPTRVIGIALYDTVQRTAAEYDTYCLVNPLSNNHKDSRNESVMKKQIEVL